MTTEEIEFTAEITKLDTDRRIAYGWAYQTADRDGNVLVDKQGDFMDSDIELEDMAHHFIMNSRMADQMHLEEPIGELVESFVFTPDKIEKLGFPAGVVPTGWAVGFKIHDDDVWQDVKTGRLKAFSIGGRAVREQVDKAQPDSADMAAAGNTCDSYSGGKSASSKCKNCGKPRSMHDESAMPSTRDMAKALEDAARAAVKKHRGNNH